MTVDEAIRYVESTWVSGAAPMILVDEVQRLRQENKRYREALERIADQDLTGGSVCQNPHRTALIALQVREVENDR